MGEGKGTALVAQVVAATSVGVLVVFAGNGSATSAAFMDQSRFSVWVALILLQCATWPVLWRVGHDGLDRLAANGFPPRRWANAARLALVLAAGAAVQLPGRLDEARRITALDHQQARILLLMMGAGVAVAPCLCAIWGVHDALREQVQDGERAVAAFGRLNELRDVATAALAAIGVLVTEVTLSSGALRATLLQLGPEFADNFPPEYVVLYGGYFTLLLAVAAAPTYGRLRARAREAVDALLPLVPPTQPGWRDRLAERRELATFLHAEASAAQSFQGAVLVAGPLVSGLVSLLVPTG